uniref:Uncharacterized protein n=1 Tax=Arundo donax TaxID=35708 RepID=A0A0A9FFA2_ARUDO
MQCSHFGSTGLGLPGSGKEARRLRPRATRTRRGTREPRRHARRAAAHLHPHYCWVEEKGQLLLATYDGWRLLGAASGGLRLWPVAHQEFHRPCIV